MEKRLIDTNNLGVGKANPGIFVCKEYAHGWNNALQAVVEAAPTIDHETLPIVRQLRADLARVTAERDANKLALEKICKCIDGDCLMRKLFCENGNPDFEHFVCPSLLAHSGYVDSDDCDGCEHFCNSFLCPKKEE